MLEFVKNFFSNLIISGTSGGNNTPMLASVGSQSSMVAGGSAATHSRDQASELDRSVRGKILSTEQSADKQYIFLSCILQYFCWFYVGICCLK